MSEAASHYSAKPNLPEFSVSELSNALKRTVEDAFPFVRVRGEISGLKRHSSGHIYFDLKDDKSVLNAVIWRLTAQRLKVRPEAGMEVICTGRITTYPGSSRYQIVVEQVELAGLGALMAMLDERKKRLAAEGLFDAARKRPLPFLPNVIGVVTSPTGAVIRDIMHRLTERFPRRVLLWSVAVQGERAAAEVAAAVAGFNALGPSSPMPRPDLIIVARGGGSVEDLMAFNEEAVIRAVAASTIPVISAVGHETDTTLIDFVSDRRAPTPTAAAEMAVPVRGDLLGQTQDLERRFIRTIRKSLDDRQRHLNQLVRVLPRADQLFASPRQRLDIASERLTHALRKNVQKHREQLIESASRLRPNQLGERITNCTERTTTLGRRLQRAQSVRLANIYRNLEALSRVLDSVSYRSVLDRGFALVRGADGGIRRRAASVRKGETLTLTFTDGEAAAVAADGSTVSAEPAIRPAPVREAPLRAKPAPSRAKVSRDQGSLF
ncbi:MAG TPA: exodeoxyribonuclease VII large subunit [Rhizomicrobium sp.]|jgi:exodeoxyribonuclease VII large subunit|nr:exodeoxyribonuclease VII large subunit [Rhizomicrobium sp.]